MAPVAVLSGRVRVPVRSPAYQGENPTVTVQVPSGTTVGPCSRRRPRRSRGSRRGSRARDDRGAEGDGRRAGHPHDDVALDVGRQVGVPEPLYTGTDKPVHGVAAATRAWMVPQVPVMSAASTEMAVESPTSLGMATVPAGSRRWRRSSRGVTAAFVADGVAATWTVWPATREPPVGGVIVAGERAPRFAWTVMPPPSTGRAAMPLTPSTVS